MSDKDDPATRSYRNPPVEHRFRKGVSGNPKGRPRKNRALVSTKVNGRPGIGFEDRIKSLAIEEAYRLGNIRIDGPVMEEQKEAQNRLRAMWPDVEQSLKEINEEIESDPNDLSLRKQQKIMTKIVNWLRDDALKRRMRDARIGTKVSKSSKD
jgi:hypothetical protein